MADGEKYGGENADDEKLRDLMIAQGLNLRRPGKKEQRFTKTDGRYIPPPEIKKEVEKLKAAKEEAARKKNRIFGVIPRGAPKKKTAKEDDAPPPPPEEKKKPAHKISKKRIRELRGTDKYDKTSKTVDLLNAESERRDSFNTVFAGGYPPPPAFEEREINLPPFPVGLLFDDETGRLVDCVFVVRKVDCTFSGVFIEGFSPDLARGERINLANVVGAYDLRTMKPVDDPTDFFTRAVMSMTPLPAGDLPLILASVRYELLALARVARRVFDGGDGEKKLWTDYISARCGLIDFDETQILDYIKALSPDDQAFFDAVDVVAGQPRHVVEPFVRAFVRAVLADGVVRPGERKALADVLCAVRERGYSPKMFGLK